LSLDDLRTALRARVGSRGAAAALARRVGRTPAAISRIVAGSLIPSAALHRLLEIACMSPLEHRRKGRPLSDSGMIRDRLRPNLGHLTKSAWSRVKADPEVLEVEYSPEWALIEARPVLARTVQAAEDEVQRLSLLPSGRRSADSYRALIRALGARSDAYRARGGSSDHAVARRLVEEVSFWMATQGARASEVKSLANDLRRWVTRRQRDAWLPTWVYDDDETLPSHPRARVVLAELRAIRVRRGRVVHAGDVPPAARSGADVPQIGSVSPRGSRASRRRTA